MRKAHFIGIAGVGMSATALLLKETGWQISGSDAEAYGPPREILSRGDITFTTGYNPKNIPDDAECFVIGRNAKLAPSENAEVRAALATGKKVYSFPEILGHITQNKKNVVVAGSYGKSTTSALLAHVLRHAGVDTGYFIGAEPVQSVWLPSPSANGQASEFVLEGDEYPSGHDDPRAKFLHLSPHDLLLTSLVHDHVNVYPTFEDYKKPFSELLLLIPKDGLIVACADEPGALALAKDSGKEVVTYGLSHGDFEASAISYGTRTKFTLSRSGVPLGEIETTLLGAHNIENIAGVAALVLSRKLVSFEALAKAVADFQGIRRRLDNIAPKSRVPVFEGFGSSYEKARAALKAIKLHFPEKPIVVIFEPHTFGWRNRANLAWYDTAFTEATMVFVAPPETQGASTHDQLSHKDILEHVGTRARPYASPNDVIGGLTGNEVVLILTSGDLHGTLMSLAKEVEAKFS